VREQGYCKPRKHLTAGKVVFTCRQLPTTGFTPFARVLRTIGRRSEAAASIKLMSSVLFAASSLLSVPACLVYGRSLWLVTTQFATLQGTPLLFVLILVLDLSIAALIVVDSRRSKLRPASSKGTV